MTKLTVQEIMPVSPAVQLLENRVRDHRRNYYDETNIPRNH